MDRKRVEAEVPDGTRLGFAQVGEGGMRGLLFDENTGRLVGHAALFEYEDDDSADTWSPEDGGDSPPQRDEDIDVLVEVIAQVLTNLAIYGLEKAAPHVQNWWNGRAVPALKEKAVPALKSAPGRVKSAVKRTKRSKDASSEAVEGFESLSDSDPADRSGPRAADIDARGPAMSSAEAQQRLANAVAAMAFAREQMRDIYFATIVDEEEQLPMAELLNEITPEHLEEAIRTT